MNGALRLVLILFILAGGTIYWFFDLRPPQNDVPIITEPVFHHSTDWELRTSIKYDVLCLLNVLTGDPFYLDYYPEAYAHFEPQLSERAKAALAELRRVLKDENGQIISAFLTLIFSVVESDSLVGLIASLDESSAIEARLRETPYFGERGWAIFLDVVDELSVILNNLKELGFESYWSANIEPRLHDKIAEIEADLPRFNVIYEVERRLGRPLESNRIVVYMLYYS